MSIVYVDAVSEQVPITNTTIYTCPSNAASAHVQFANCTNEDGTSTTISINIVQSGGSVGVTNLYVAPTTVNPNATNGLTGIINAILKPGDFISAIAADADRLNLKVGIKEIYA